MKIVSVEPTPNPNSMKLNLDEALPAGTSLFYTTENAGAAPTYVRSILAVDGVRSVYQVADFMAVERAPAANWQQVLAGVGRVLDVESEAAVTLPDEVPGRVSVFVQMFRGLPMQVKLTSGSEEVRVALPERFKLAAAKAAATSADFLKERRWAERGVRYGDMQEVGAEVAAEVAAAYDEERLAQLLERALQQRPGGEEAAPEALAPEAVAERLKDPDWRRRYGALERLEPLEANLPVVAQALADANPSVRRLAVVYLGDIGGEVVLPFLTGALKDPSPAVRRAAGDCLSDLGAPEAMAAMAEALKDPSKLVRWRAARYLYEVGDASAVPALQAAQDDPEFEIALQVRMALERIESGAGSVEPAWKRLIKGWD